jgi:hypothetical protein
MLSIRGSAPHIPDSGPLISLGRADRLVLLLLLDLPIYLVDQVAFEATHDQRHEDAARIGAFIEGNPDRVRVVTTFVGTAAAAARRRAPGTRQRGLGEAAIAEFYSRIDEVVEPDEPVLVLFEDSDVRRITALVRGNVHLLSTWGLLKGMGEVGLIRPAEDIWQAILRAGREPAKIGTDQAAAASGGGQLIGSARRGTRVRSGREPC